MVQIISLATASIAAFGLVGSAVAHAGGHAPEDLARRGIHWNANKRSLADCANTLKGRSLRENSVVRRSELADKLRSKRGFSDSKLYTFKFLVISVLTDGYHRAINQGP